MDVFEAALTKLWPLYSLVGLGFLAAKALQIPKEPIAKILIYLLSPAVIFFGVAKADLSNGELYLPFFIFLICSTLCLFFLWIGKKTLHGKTPNILAFGAGNANSGYFAIPVGIGLFGEEALPLFVVCNFGFIFYEYTLAYYVTARGQHSAKEAFLRVLRLPSMYAFACALLINFSGIKLSQPIIELGQHFRGAYFVLGMMLIGFGAASLTRIKWDRRYLALALLAKFAAWPCLLQFVLFLDTLTFSLISPLSAQILSFLSIVPMAANTVAVASVLNAEPEKASLAVLISTLMALISVPVFAALYGL